MSERLFFILDDAAAAETAVAALKQSAGMTDQNIALLANPSVPLATMPEATPDDASDFLPALAKGSAIGGSAGLLAGLTAVSIPAAGLTLGGGALLASTGLGAAFGAWVSALVGASIAPNDVQQFQDAIDAGKLLLMVDVDEQARAGVLDAVRAAVPAAEFRGTQGSQT